MKKISYIKFRSVLLSSLVIGAAHCLKPSQYGSGIPETTPTTSRPYNNNNGRGGPYSSDSFGNIDSYENHPFEQESVEERLASWREQQQQRYEEQIPIKEQNPRDEQGRLRLLTTVSRGSISVFFFILMWRSVHHLELADQMFKKSSKRLFLVVPTIILFICNMAGCVASVSSQTLKSKKRMKAILNLNKLVEMGLFLFNILRLALSTNTLLPREMYVGKSLTNFVFIAQCQLFTRVTWDAVQATQGAAVTPDTDRQFVRNEYDYDDVNANSNMGYSQGQEPPYTDVNDYYEDR